MVEAVSPAPGGRSGAGGGDSAAGRRAARSRAASAGGGGGGGGSGGARILRTPGPVPAMVGEVGGEEGDTGEHEEEREFMMTPGAAARAGYHDDTMSEDSVANTPRHHRHPSVSSPESSVGSAKHSHSDNLTLSHSHTLTLSLYRTYTRSHSHTLVHVILHVCRSPFLESNVKSRRMTRI